MPRATQGVGYVAVISVDERLICSCNQQNMELALACRTTSLPCEEATECIHVKATRRLEVNLGEWSCYFEDDEHLYNASSNPCLIYQVSDTAVLVFLKGRFQTVYVRGKALYCDCDGHRKGCKFIIALKNRLKDDDDESLMSFKEQLRDDGPLETRYQQTSISQLPIEFCGIPAELNVGALTSTCSDCGEECPNASASSIKLYDRDTISTVVSYHGPCDSCGSNAICDGKDVGVLNMGTYLMAHRLLNDYLHSFLLNGATMYSFYRTWVWRLLNVDQPAPPYEVFRLAWLSFVDLTVIPDQYFECPKCRDKPDIIICDGICLSYPKKFMAKHAVSSTGMESQTLFSGSSHTQRTFPLLPSVRKTLLQLLTDDSPDYDQCLLLVGETSLSRVFQAACDHQTLPHYWNSFLKDILKNSPITMFITEGSKAAIVNLKTCAPNGDQLLILQRHSSAFFKFAKEMSVEDATLISPIIDAMISVYDYIADIPSHDTGFSAETSVRLEVFPRLPLCHSRGSYTSDSQKNELKRCEKDYARHTNLSPGIFTMLCQHGICYGFRALDCVESPNVPFTILRTRFVEAPKVVVYDNACRLHSYSLNRDPGYFRKTRFLVDRFHWKNHTGCCSAYNITAHPDLSSINTQVAEQSNALLNRLKSMLSYMIEENFVKHVTMFLGYRNLVKRLQLVPPSSQAEVVVQRHNQLTKR